MFIVHKQESWGAVIHIQKAYDKIANSGRIIKLKLIMINITLKRKQNCQLPSRFSFYICLVRVLPFICILYIHIILQDCTVRGKQYDNIANMKIYYKNFIRKH